MSAALQASVRAAFLNQFGDMPELVAVAPGRVNLIGEHTDYNDGFVLPCALAFTTVVAMRRRTDPQVRAVARDLDLAADQFDLRAVPPAQGDGHWTDYVRGMLLTLHADDPLPGGVDLLIGGDVPQGAGLSSSAALTVAIGTAVRALFGRAPDAVQVARLAQQAENRYVGCQCGIMDQLASACGEAGHALLLDCRSLASRAVPLPAGFRLMILHSRVRRGLVDSAYNERRAQCERAARHYGVAALRDLDGAALDAGSAGLDATALRRARHVVTENARVLLTVDALQQGDAQAIGRLMAASHASMRDDFAITVPAIDQLVDIVTAQLGGVGGARMTGGGFGGCVVALVPADRVDAVRDAVAQHYRSPEGALADVYVCTAERGAHVVHP